MTAASPCCKASPRSAMRDALLRFLGRKLDDRSLAEDFTQETWLRAANSPGGAAIGNPRSYLFRIASNLVLDHQRRAGQRVELKVAEETAAAVADARPAPGNVVLYRSEFARLVCQPPGHQLKRRRQPDGERAGSDRARIGPGRRIGSGRSWQIAFHPSRQ